MANHQPTGTPAKFNSAQKNTPYKITAIDFLKGFSDDDEDVLKVVGDSPEVDAKQGTLVKTTAGWTFTPAKDFVGNVTIDYVITDSKTAPVHAEVSFVVEAELKPIAEIFKSNGYYSTFADLAKAAYHLAPEEQLHKDQSKYVAQASVNGDGQNYVKPYADEAWGRMGKDWEVLKPSDLRVETSGTYHWIKSEGKTEIIKYDSAWGTATDTMENDLPNGNASFWFESDGVYHANNAAAFAVRSQDSVVISFRGTNDNDGGLFPGTADMSDWKDLDAHYGELLEFTNEIDMYVRNNNIKNVYVTGHSLGGGMALGYMDQHPANTNKTDNGSTITYEAVTFAAPAYKTAGLKLDERVICIEMDGDGVPDTGGYHQGRIVTINSPLVHEDTKKSYGGIAEYHSMDIYMEAAHSLDSQLPATTKTVAGTSVHGFNLNSFDSSWEAQVILPMLETKGTADGYTWDGKISPKFVAMTGDNFLDGTGKSYYSGDKNVMIGGVGNDTYDVDNNQDLIIEKANSGTDSVKSFVSFALPANVENLTLKSTMGADYDDFSATGNELNNVLDDNEGDNVLSGLSGNDTLIGGLGKDTLIGGLGKDIVSGGKGADIFKFNSIAESGSTVKTNDVIMDFNHDKGDKIDLKSIDANTKLAKDQEFTFVGSALLFDIAVANGTKFTNPLYFNEVTQILYGDVNSDNKPDFSIQLSGVSSLEASDFIL